VAPGIISAMNADRSSRGKPVAENMPKIAMQKFGT
jgi:hypothetical protein